MNTYTSARFRCICTCIDCANSFSSLHIAKGSSFARQCCMNCEAFNNAERTMKISTVPIEMRSSLISYYSYLLQNGLKIYIRLHIMNQQAMSRSSAFILIHSCDSASPYGRKAGAKSRDLSYPMLTICTSFFLTFLLFQDAFQRQLSRD